MAAAKPARVLAQTSFGLAQYADALSARCCDVASLKRLDRRALERVADEAGMKVGHIQKFCMCLLSPEMLAHVNAGGVASAC